MQPSQANGWVSEPRFAPYLHAAGGDHELAVELYVWNAQVAASLMETLHHVEVLLRNAIDAQFTPVDHHAPATRSWLCDPTVLNVYSRQRVDETIRRVQRGGRTATRGRVVAGVSFGFWRALFDRRYQQLWITHLHQAFPHGTGDRREIATIMAALVPFRNRLAHQETIALRPVNGHHETMLKLAGLIDPDAATWIESISTLSTVTKDKPHH